MSSIFKLTATGVLVASLSACAGVGDTDGERAIIGAATGAVIADVTDNDVATGAVVGAAAGVFCDDAGICR